MRTRILTVCSLLGLVAGTALAGEACCPKPGAAAAPGCAAKAAVPGCAVKDAGRACPAGAGGAVCATHQVTPAAQPAAAYGEVDTAGLAVLLKAKTPLVLLDARTGKWDDGQRLPGAKALGAEATAEQAAALIPAKDALVVVYCSNLKCPASKMLAQRLAALGYTNILKYPQGIEEWLATGHAVEAPPAK